MGVPSTNAAAGSEHISASWDAFDQTSFSECAELAKVRGQLEHVGASLVQGLIPTDAVVTLQNELRELIRLRRRSAGLSADSEITESGFDDGFMELNRANREHGAVIYRAARRLLGNIRIATHPNIIRLSRALLGDLLIISEDRSIRIDQPSEDDYLFPWHQDYPFNMDSDDSLVFWIPLRDVTPLSGQLVLAAGSHRRGIYPLHVVDSKNERQNRAQALRIADESVVDTFDHLSVPVAVGDALVFSSMLLHRSGLNRSDHARWTLQVRVGNFRDPGAIQRNWPGAMAANAFESIHPEAIK